MYCIVTHLSEFLHVELAIFDVGVVLRDDVSDHVSGKVDVALLERFSQFVDRDVATAIAVHLNPEKNIEISREQHTT